MFPCRFIYRFKTGGSSDSLDQTYQVHVVPRVGDRLYFPNDEGGGSEHEVRDVSHWINVGTGKHEIIVGYGDRAKG